MRSVRLDKNQTSYHVEESRRDILVSERAGSSPMHKPLRSNVVPVYKNCAFTSISPFSTSGQLGEYVRDRTKRGDLMSAEEMHSLALQAARGLYQAQLYKDGKATNVHADINPSQFLLFDPPEQRSQQKVLQINDFNRCKFLTRNITNNNETCPFQTCHTVHTDGPNYRAPEEHVKCADQTEAIDVFSLGGIFYHLLSDGRDPWYQYNNISTATELLLKGEKPKLPTIEEYDSDKRIVAWVEERAKHPAYIVLRDVMMKCWTFKPEDRPSSLEVVKMLEEERNETRLSAQ